MCFVSVDNSEIGYGPLTNSPSPPPTKHHRPESSRALLHGILSGQHPGLHAHALITAHRTSAYTTTTTGMLHIQKAFYLVRNEISKNCKHP